MKRIPATDFAIEVPLTLGPGGSALQALEPDPEVLNGPRLCTLCKYLHDVPQSLNARTVEQARTSLASTNPQGRFIQPKEVAAAVVWLCSEAAGSVTGQALSLSGGETW